MGGDTTKGANTGENVALRATQTGDTDLSKEVREVQEVFRSPEVYDHFARAVRVFRLAREQEALLDPVFDGDGVEPELPGDAEPELPDIVQYLYALHPQVQGNFPELQDIVIALRNQAPEQLRATIGAIDPEVFKQLGQFFDMGYGNMLCRRILKKGSKTNNLIRTRLTGLVNDILISKPERIGGQPDWLKWHQEINSALYNDTDIWFYNFPLLTKIRLLKVFVDTAVITNSEDNGHVLMKLGRYGSADYHNVSQELSRRVLAKQKYMQRYLWQKYVDAVFAEHMEAKRVRMPQPEVGPRGTNDDGSVGFGS